MGEIKKSTEEHPVDSHGSGTQEKDLFVEKISNSLREGDERL